MYIYFMLHLHINLISVVLLQNEQNGEHIQKSQTYYFFYFAE